jgi:mRNA interferase RelE/StbE
LKTEFKSSFLKDLKKIRSGNVKRQLLEVISEVENSKNLSEIEHVKKLRGVENYYRIRIGDYRLGLKVENNIVIFVRFLDRKDIYRYFP